MGKRGREKMSMCNKLLLLFLIGFGFLTVDSEQSVKVILENGPIYVIEGKKVWPLLDTIMINSQY